MLDNFCIEKVTHEREHPKEWLNRKSLQYTAMQNYFLFCSLAFLILSVGFNSLFVFAAYSQETSIPSWIKTTAGWWSASKISDEEFTEGLEYLIQNNIIKSPETFAVTKITDW